MSEENQKKNYLQKLQEKWNLDSLKQVIIVLIVFAFTGTTILFIKQPVLDFFGVQKGGFVNTVFYLLLVLPLYQILLLFYGFIFGQFKFFWEWEKKTFRRIGSLFGRKSKKSDSN
ncbi:DUF6787 family protein [Algoriphagus sediminis]|uniref:DUF6787 domain-containing protein n=1 Tax=Algoriphagus sediminis TaxID=3057113 RepID=A0ABT7YCI9_9BACT|nr:DUF6787 family protein [Algoriphagus sediminis]MDN3204242.1 hypothetical protein [Algoriphagus sediminis]